MFCIVYQRIDDIAFLDFTLDVREVFADLSCYWFLPFDFKFSGFFERPAVNGIML